ncbi:hypothetical protein AAFF_G00035690 [Aldrovandia affinis]|uniref:Secreted protein n=1 Tax=Aldrovandia affinis TaxID=143900 RepID=A0AAD7WFP6_9TELE|nr:hypothetical protein AAFF_G00035690 [Aldrovandia affinis]
MLSCLLLAPLLLCPRSHLKVVRDQGEVFWQSWKEGTRNHSPGQHLFLHPPPPTPVPPPPVDSPTCHRPSFSHAHPSRAQCHRRVTALPPAGLLTQAVDGLKHCHLFSAREMNLQVSRFDSVPVSCSFVFG